MKTFTITILAFLLFPFFLYSQKEIKTKKLLKDFDALIECIEAHPDPYRYLTEEEFNRMTDSIRGLITAPMNVISYYKICAPIIHTIKDGHTSLRLPTKYMKNHMKKYGAFPYHIHLTDDEEMYVIKNYGDDMTIPLGARIDSINGISIHEFVSGIDKYTFYERKPFRNTTIETDLDRLLHLYFNSFTELEIKYFTDQNRVHTVKNIKYKLYKKEVKNQNVNIYSLIRKGNQYEYKKLTKGVGLLKIHSFVIPKEREFRRFLSNKFYSIKNDSITSLIIDVRGNLGGYPRASAEIFHYLTDRPFKTMDLSQMKVSETYREKFRKDIPHANLSAMQFRTRKYSINLNSLFEYEVGTFVTDAGNKIEMPITKDNEFKGDMYLLTDRTSFSAASSFAATFKCYGLGTIVGEPTGGTKVFFGNAISIKMKYSKLSLRVGTNKNYTTCFSEDENEAIIPDFPASASVLDRINDSDLMLYFTLRLIKKIKKARISK